MMAACDVLTGARIFDGRRFLDGHAVVIEDGRVAAIVPASAAPEGVRHRLDGILAPAFVDLQVNGGGGHQVGRTTTPDGLRLVCAAHRGLGSAGVLPTLISDTKETTAAVISAAVSAFQAGVPGFLGLHLEGPHLDPRRKGAHDAALVRPMDDDDLQRLCATARRLPALMVTLAPESATPGQIAALAGAGAVVSLGHSDCSYEVARAAFAAGARCATHLFNAMSQLGSRQPGLAGAVLHGSCAAGLIADGIHVHAATIEIALRSRQEGIFLVSDCMAFAGTDLTEICLQGRRILRRNGRLTLEDGTLAGADLALAQAVGNLVRMAGIAPERALAMASRIPAETIGADHVLGHVAPGRPAELVLLDAGWNLAGCWSGSSWLQRPAQGTA